ncbi:MAG: radical SAM protein [Candidatus Methanoculleus thermohydrogenotrophicum]|nr:radical SAM protein [Candidatus Methanoculleus thermohydrogenotrophicum]HQC91195.1 radical SAM protein [Candidatus Methanoculleus thermohydrogenotrophicum]
MDVLLINPPDTKSKYKKYFNIRIPPLGILYIAAVLEENRVNVEIMDCAAGDIDYTGIEERVEKTDPFLVGITSTTPLISEALRSAEAVKKVSDAYTVLGGPHATFMHNEILRENASIDFIVKGEGEYTVLDLYQTLRTDGDLGTVEGLVYRREDRIIENKDRPLVEDLDSLPYPARHLLPRDTYRIFDDNMPVATMICSRGCPMQCSFCASSALHGKRVRRRSPGDVIEEIQHIQESLGISAIGFMDDTFTLFPRWVEAFCSEVIDREMAIEWGCTARVDRIDRDLMELMKEAGCHTLFIGVESGDQNILDRIKKGTRIDQIKNVFGTAHDLGMRTIASVAIGLPGETKETANKTIKFVKDLKPSFALFSVATPYPGTEFYNKTREAGKLQADWSQYDLLSPIVETMSLTLEEIKSLQKKAFREFYLRPLYILQNLKQDGFSFLKIVKAALST